MREIETNINNMSILKGKTILVTGGTGSFGKKFTELALKEHDPKAIRIFSRDELKQYEMDQCFDDPRLRFFIGNVRDKQRLDRAMQGVDIVLHAAALKQVPSCEYNPFEAVKTNILGTQNVIESAIDNDIERLMLISTDKAVNPVNLYGATKLCAEKLFIQSNAYTGDRPIKISVARYGNVMSSRGSVIPIFKEQKKQGVLTLTDERMTRFWITQWQAVNFIINCIEKMQGGEIFIPKIPSMRILDLAKAIAPDATIKKTGIRPGEKINEVLLAENETSYAREFENCFVIQPQYSFVRTQSTGGKILPKGFRYSSDTNSRWLTKEEIQRILEDL